MARVARVAKARWARVARVERVERGCTILIIVTSQLIFIACSELLFFCCVYWSRSSLAVDLGSNPWATILCTVN